MGVKRKKDNILVIGATGPIGKTLVERLQKQPCHLSVVARRAGYCLGRATILRGDLNDFDFCRRVLKNVDIVYYTASSRKNLEWHIKEPWSFAEGNVTPLLNVLKALEQSRVKKFLYMSTIQVAYAAADDAMVDGYAFGKSINEMLVRAFAAEHKEIDIKIIRSTAVYGPGDSFDPKVANLIPSLIGKIDKAKASFTIWGKGARKMQFIYVDDVVANLLAIARSSGDNFFILGHPAAYSIKELAGMIVKKFKKNLKVTHDLSKPDKPTKLFVFRNKVKPKVNLSEGLTRIIKYYRQHHA